MGYMYSQEIIGKKKKTKRIKPELIIEEKYTWEHICAQYEALFTKISD